MVWIAAVAGRLIRYLASDSALGTLAVFDMDFQEVTESRSGNRGRRGGV